MAVGGEGTGGGKDEGTVGEHESLQRQLRKVEAPSCSRPSTAVLTAQGHCWAGTFLLMSRGPLSLAAPYEL